MRMSQTIHKDFPILFAIMDKFKCSSNLYFDEQKNKFISHLFLKKKIIKVEGENESSLIANLSQYIKPRFRK